MKGTEDGEEFSGYVITMAVDPNDAFGVDSLNLEPFPFEAKVRSDTEIDVCAPILEFNDRGGHDELIRDKLNSHAEPECLTKGMDNARKKYEKKWGTVEKTAKKIYRLTFPGNVKLSAKDLEVNKDEEDDTLALGGYTIFQEIDGLNQKDTLIKTETGKDQAHTVHYYRHASFCVPKLYWRVADLKVEAFLSGSTTTKVKERGTRAARALMG